MVGGLWRHAGTLDPPYPLPLLRTDRSSSPLPDPVAAGWRRGTWPLAGPAARARSRRRGDGLQHPAGDACRWSEAIEYKKPARRWRTARGSAAVTSRLMHSECCWSMCSNQQGQRGGGLARHVERLAGRVETVEVTDPVRLLPLPSLIISRGLAFTSDDGIEDQESRRLADLDGAFAAVQPGHCFRPEPSRTPSWGWITSASLLIAHYPALRRGPRPAGFPATVSAAGYGLVRCQVQTDWRGRPIPMRLSHLLLQDDGSRGVCHVANGAQAGID